MNDERLLAYHIEQTGDKFAEVRDELKTLNEKIDALHEFKITLLVNTRWVSLIVSAVCGLVTMIATTALSYFVQKHGG